MISIDSVSKRLALGTAVRVSSPISPGGPYLSSPYFKGRTKPTAPEAADASFSLSSSSLTPSVLWKKLTLGLAGASALFNPSTPLPRALAAPPAVQTTTGQVKTAGAADTKATENDEESRRAEAKKAFESVVELYASGSMGDEQAVKKLHAIDTTLLTPRYQGLHMLMDHYFQRRQFDEENTLKYTQLGVDLSRPTHDTPHSVDIYSKRDLEKPKPKLLEAGGIGEKDYNALLNINHFVNLTAPQLTQVAKGEFDKLEKQMNDLAEKITPGTGNWKTLYEDIRKEHPTKEALLEVYRKEVETAKQFVKDQDLLTVPKETVTVIETPFWYRDAIPFAAYLPHGNGRGEFMVTSVIDTDPSKEEEQLRAHNYGFIPAVVIHEAFPGHHLQHAHTDRIHRDLSKAEDRTTERVYDLTDYSPYFGEGWAVYCEEVALEKGYYDKGNGTLTKEQVNLVALRSLLWRAARAYLDPQVNTGKMTYEAAVQFLVDHVVMEKDRAEIEVNRYFRRPTEVASYMVGKLQFQQLRKQLEEHNGKDFSLKTFHDDIFKEGQEIPVPPLARIRFDQPLALPVPPPPEETPPEQPPKAEQPQDGQQPPAPGEGPSALNPLP